MYNRIWFVSRQNSIVQGHHHMKSNNGLCFNIVYVTHYLGVAASQSLEPLASDNIVRAVLAGAEMSQSIIAVCYTSM